MLQAKASDSAGNVGTSTQISVSVQNDTTPPEVSVLSPAAGSTVSGSAQIQVAGSDNVAITEVKCFLNGSLIATNTDLPAVFLWDTTKYTNGTYTVEAQAFDAAGNSAAASHPGVTVSNASTAPDTTRPIVAITSPGDGATVNKNFSVKISASDDVGVALVEFYVDAKLSGSSTSASSSFTVNSNKLSKGPHTLVAKAYDAAKNQGVSPTVTVYK
jgi:hypothetical protein